MPRNSETPRTLVDAHRQHAYNDPAFIEGLERIRTLEASGRIEQAESEKEQLADRHRITVADINMYMLPIYVGAARARYSVVCDINRRELNVTLPFDVTRAELLELWESIDSIQQLAPHSNTSRRRLPENHELLYAISLARHAGKTFSQIFGEYRCGNLQSYRGGNTQFSTDDDLERFYRRYYTDDMPIT